MIPAILGLIDSPLTKYLIGGLVVVAAFGGTYYKGRVDGSLITEARLNEEHRKEKEFFAKELNRIQKEIQVVINDIVAERREWNDKVGELQAALGKTTEQVFKKYLRDVTVTKEVVKYVTKPETVTVYVPGPADKNCVVNKGFVDLHNKAAVGASKEEIDKGKTAPGIDQDSKKKLSEVAEIVASNYYQYEQVRLQLTALQNIIRDFQKKQKELSDRIAKEENDAKAKGVTK